jgi:hypothetical protein
MIQERSTRIEVMKRLILFFLLLPLLAGCMVGAEPQDEPAVEGPALIMFYTDN